jgi:hypothetical protein
VGALTPAALEALGDDERLALCLNLYNALAVNTILRWMKAHNGAPPSSINDLSTWRSGSVWKQRAGRLAGSSVTLDFLEHGVLRAEWAEPRVHACLVCASLSCPNLRSEAFDARRLDAQLDDQARAWLANPTKGALVTPAAAPSADGPAPLVTLSRIFLWFRDDFVRGERAGSSSSSDDAGSSRSSNSAGVAVAPAPAAAGAELAFVRRYTAAVPEGTAVAYFPYNWSLNNAA